MLGIKFAHLPGSWLQRACWDHLDTEARQQVVARAVDPLFCRVAFGLEPLAPVPGPLQLQTVEAAVSLQSPFKPHGSTSKAKPPFGLMR